ncbi:FCD domain-containing protein [Bauldia sp.]|uniref:FCD domain-containing protein n=1 Tax=Bauldia sp. TaxID=2575872 RepID=UPI003BABBD53
MRERRNGSGDSRAADHIVTTIERRISEGTLADSAPLPPERVLMEEFGASRTVVREAITALANRGLIETRPRYRPIVRRVGYETVIDTTGPIIRKLLNHPTGVENLYQTRVFIERGLVREAAMHASKTNIGELKRALAENHAAIPSSDDFYRTDTAFHRVFYKVPGNPIFPAVHEGFVSWLAPHWERMRRSPEDNQHNYRAHEAIYTAILERDPDAAEDALVAHLADAWDLVSGTFD